MHYAFSVICFSQIYNFTHVNAYYITHLSATFEKMQKLQVLKQESNIVSNFNFAFHNEI